MRAWDHTEQGTMLKEEGKQFSVFMSENICTLVDLFDKAVAEGPSNQCGNEVGRWRRNIETYINR